MAKILLIEGEYIKALDKVKFTEESKLQDYLEKYPALIPLPEIVEGASDLLCIGKEVSAGLGAVDLLFIDKDGLLTVVETKLAKNPEARREVIGQIIEYASYISQWTTVDVYEIANERLKSNLDEVIEKISGDDFSAEDFRSNIEQNLKNGRIRLIIAVNELIEPLRATVTFLNSYSKLDILLLQVSSFEESKTRKVLIPSLFGYATKTTGMGRQTKHWDIETFLAGAKQKCEPKTIDAMTKLYEFTKNNADKTSWGKGAFFGSFTFNKLKNETIIPVFTIYSDGWIYLNFGVIKNKQVGLESLESFRLRLNLIPGVKIAKDIITKNKRATIKIEVLAETEELKNFQDAVFAFCQQIESGDK